jgi:hypothetical protein
MCRRRIFTEAIEEAHKKGYYDGYLAGLRTSEKLVRPDRPVPTEWR